MTPLMRQIIREVAVLRGVTSADILGDSHRRKFTWPRQETMYRLRLEGRWSLPRIGAVLGRDHSTVAFGCRQHAERNGLIPVVSHRGKSAKGVACPRPFGGRPQVGGANQAHTERMETTPRHRRPTPAQVAGFALDAALAHDVPVAIVRSRSLRPPAVRARKEAWLELLARGYTVSGTAAVWGCDRKSIQRAQREVARMAAE